MVNYADFAIGYNDVIAVTASDNYFHIRINGHKVYTIKKGSCAKVTVRKWKNYQHFPYIHPTGSCL